MRLLTIVIVAFLLGCSGEKTHPIDAAYLQLLTQRIDSAGHKIDSVIQECEQAMIDAGYFQNHDSKNYIDFIELVKESGDIDASKWLIGQNTSMLLNDLDISFQIDIDSSELARPKSEDSSSLVYKGPRIMDEIYNHGDLSPTIITESVLKYVNTSDFDSRLYRLLFYKFLVRTVDVDKGLSVKLPDYPEVANTPSVKVNPRLVLEVVIDDNDNLIVAGEAVDLGELTNLTKNFLRKTPSADGHIVADMSQKIVSLKNRRGTTYKRYVNVYNEITRSYTEVRNEMSMDTFGTPFKDLESLQQKAIRKLVPMRISEAEPVAD